VQFSRNERVAVHWTILTLPVIATIVAASLLGSIAQQFFTILAMFFLAWLLAFVLDPVVEWIVHRVPVLPRGLTAALVFVGMVVIALLLLVGIASSVLSSAESVLNQSGTIRDAVVERLAPFQAQLDALGVEVDLVASVEAAVDQLSQSSAALLGIVLESGLVLFTQGTAIIFIAVVMVASKDGLLRFIRRLVPEERSPLLDEFMSATTRSFGGFIRGQFGTAALYGVIVALIGLMFGVPFVALNAVVTAALQSIPYFGQLVSWIPLVFTTLVFKPDMLVPVLLVFLVILLVMQNIVTPKVMASAVGLNPILVLAAVFVGAQVAGALGAVFGVPVAAVGATLFNAWLDQVRPEPAAVAARAGQTGDDELPVGGVARAATGQKQASLERSAPRLEQARPAASSTVEERQSGLEPTTPQRRPATR
jgi:predicted PurR-regulated permease PerM